MRPRPTQQLQDSWNLHFEWRTYLRASYEFQSQISHICPSSIGIAHKNSTTHWPLQLVNCSLDLEMPTISIRHLHVIIINYNYIIYDKHCEHIYNVTHIGHPYGVAHNIQQHITTSMQRYLHLSCTHDIITSYTHT